MIAGNVFFPQKIVPHGSETDTFFWNVLGLSLAVDTVASAFVPKNKTYSAYLILGAVLMSIVSWWFNCILLDISI